MKLNKCHIDHFPDKQILLTGSSSFELGNQVGEPLTGRHFTLTLLPLAQQEMHIGPFELAQSLETFLVYGSYPDILLTTDTIEKERLLKELVASYLYKDVLALDYIKSPKLLRNIAQMIAWQVGQEVSLNEIAVALQTSVHTVARYLDLLEKMFVIKRVGGFSRNLRNEINKKARYYFLDNGVRNAVIGNFNPLSSRNDQGALWENFVFTEFLKRDTITDTASTFYFWRTHQGQEIDIIREAKGILQAYECKWNPKKIIRIPRTFREAYPEINFTVLTPKNYLDIFLDTTKTN
jgi:predicted AAA+ superfamily ATPase